MTAFITGLLLTIIIVVCMRDPLLGDFYSQHLYPYISTFLSRLSSPFPFSLQGVAIAVLAVAGMLFIVSSCMRRTGFWKCIRRLVTLILWTFVWFYSGWCLNYSRSSIYSRMEAERAPYDSTAFADFIYSFRETLNDSYVEEQSVGEETLEAETKGFYASVPERYGLCKPREWQHAKRMMPEGYHTATGILGYMGPLFSEFHVNTQLLPSQYPFTWAHEYSHLLGVSSEAEANWWAWNACISSDVPAIRYSACLTMLSYILRDAQRDLSEEDYARWAEGIRPEVKEDSRKKAEYWNSKRNPALDRVQGFIYDRFLKSNNIPSGTRNYSEVISMMMSIGYGE